MSSNNLHTIVAEINSRAKDYDIGRLQEIRKKLLKKKRASKSIFTSLTTFDDYAFHYGGRKELQFNIGIEKRDGVDKLRFGVAFSFGTSRSLPKLDELYPKVQLFNDFVQFDSDRYTDMRMWHYIKSKQSSDYMPTAIPSEIVTDGVFVFLGKRQDISNINYDDLLNTFDNLLPLYQYVEIQNGSLSDTLSNTAFQFHSGYKTGRAGSAIISHALKELDANLRHNILQEELCKKLSAKYGVDNVGSENPSGIGTRIDVVVRQKDEFWFYEIKTAYSPRACIRQAIGQLLEYAFWNDSQKVTRLIVVGETALDEEGSKYLQTLQKRFLLPIKYEQVKI